MGYGKYYIDVVERVKNNKARLWPGYAVLLFNMMI